MNVLVTRHTIGQHLEQEHF